MLPITNQPDRFGAGAEFWIDDRRVVIATSRPHQGGYLVRFEGVDDRNGADALRGATLTADPVGAPPDGEVWVHDVIGKAVHDRADTRLGEVVAVEANPAHDMLVLDTGPLIPMVFVVDVGDDGIVVDLPDGLLDL